jgi:2-dehydropantoate 2-reductase
MKIAILGAGAMGSFFGGVLAENAHAVTLLDIDTEHLDTVRRDGLRLVNGSQDRRITNLAVSRPELFCSTPDLLVVFTKSLHTRTALASVQRVIGAQTFVLTLQNGLGNVEAISEFVPPERVLIGVTTWPADKLGAAHVASHSEGKIRMMCGDGVRRPECDAVAQVLDAAGLNCIVDDNVWSAIWEKVAFNAALNSLCAVSGCAVDQLGRVPDGAALALKIVGEVLAVARAKGICVDPQRAACTVLHAIETHHGHKPSMLQDVLARRRTEIESINGAVVMAARELNVAVVHTETLLQLVRLVEARNTE